MKIARNGMLVVVILVSAAVIVSPAFATPNITASSGTRAVAPFITPIGDSARSNIVGTSTDLRYASAGGAAMRCRNSIIGGFIGSTHTQITITSAVFGNGAVGNCDITSAGFSGVVRGGGGLASAGTLDSISGTATTTRPWFLHFRRGPDGGGSSVGTMNMPSGASSAFSSTDTVFGLVCQYTFAAQSVDVTYTNATRLLVISDSTVLYTETSGNSGCSASGNARLNATFALRAATARDALTVTAGS